jgi:D,D-heptose 1,7-bisphosphate phosphatase
MITDKARCIFFDRDGIVNVSPGPGYVERVDDFHIIPEFIDCAQIARSMGFIIAIITNQRGVARGIMTLEALDEIHATLKDALEKKSIELAGIYSCTHERNSCNCRKPKPGMLLQAAEEHKIDLAKSWMIGDSESDIEAGQRAGCRTIRVCPAEMQTTADFRVENMRELAQKLKSFISVG